MSILFSPSHLKMLGRSYKVPPPVLRLLRKTKLQADAPVALARNYAIPAIDSNALSFLPERVISGQQMLLDALVCAGIAESCPDFVDGLLCVKNGYAFEAIEVPSQYSSWSHFVFALNQELAMYDLKLFFRSYALFSPQAPFELLSPARLILTEGVTDDEFVLFADIHTNSPVLRPWELIAFKNWLLGRHPVYFLGGQWRTMLLCQLPNSQIDLDTLNNDLRLLQQSKPVIVDQHTNMQTFLFDWNK